MTVHVHRRGRLPKIFLPSPATVRRAVQTVLKSEKSEFSGELNVVFVDNPMIRSLHKKFLNDGTLTDVIAFGYDSGADIFISVPVAVQNAERFGESTGRELARLVIHGLLHLHGYSDHGKKAKEKMWKKQEALVSRLLGPRK